MIGYYEFNTTILTIMLLASNIGIIGLGAYIYVRAQTGRASHWFGGILISFFLWSWTYMMGQVAPNDHIAWILIVVQISAALIAGPFALCFSRAYRGWSNRHSFLVALSFFAYVIIIGLLITNPYHSLYFSRFDVNGYGYNVGKVISDIFLLLCFIAAVFFYTKGIRKPSIYWKNQLSYVGSAGAILVIASFIGNAKVFKDGMVFPLLMLPFSLILIGIAIVRYQFLDVLPYSMSETLNFIDDGFLVFGVDGILEDYNKAFFDKMAPVDQCRNIDDVIRLFGKYSGDVRSLDRLKRSLFVDNYRLVTGELTIFRGLDANRMYLQYSAKAIKDKEGTKIATIVTFHDISQMQKLYQTLEEKKDQLILAAERLEKHIETVQKLTVETERNRLMSEIHDTLGHTMSEVLALLERCDILLSDEGTKALGKASIEEALKRSRDSLTDIRDSVNKFRKMGMDL